MKLQSQETYFSIGKFYDGISSKYEINHSKYITITNKEHLTKINFLCKKGKILEIGCGSGRILSEIKETDLAIGLDISTNMLKIARSKNCVVVQANSTLLPFKNNGFDLVYSFKVLSHIPDIQKTINEIIRVVKPGGYILLEFYNDQSFKYIVIKKIKDFLKLKLLYSRYDSIKTITSYFSTNVKLICIRGYNLIPLIEIFCKIPFIGNLIYSIEKRLCKTRLNKYGGYLVAELIKK